MCNSNNYINIMFAWGRGTGNINNCMYINIMFTRGRGTSNITSYLYINMRFIWGKTLVTLKATLTQGVHGGGALVTLTARVT